MNLNNAVKKSPQRMCIACRQMLDKKNLLRVVRAPDGSVSVDRTGKKNGRGAYVCTDAKCRVKCAKGLLKKHLECDIPDEVCEELLFRNQNER